MLVAQNMYGHSLYLGSALLISKDFLYFIYYEKNDINVQISDNQSWSSILEIDTAGANADYRCFDVAYESKSGGALLCYFNKSSGDHFPKYRVWNGIGLSAEQDALNDPLMNSDIYWLELASNPISDEIMMVILNSDNDIWAQIWNGTNWWGLRRIETTVSDEQYPCFDAVYESQSGYGFIAWGDNGDNLRYRRWMGNWNEAEAGWGTAQDTVHFVRLTAEPNSNYIAAAFLDKDPEIVARVWDGSAWGTPRILTLNPEITENRCFDIAWESKSDKEGLIVYGESNDIPRYRSISDTTISGTELTLPTDPNPGDGDPNWVELESDPNTDDVMLMYVVDDGGGAIDDLAAYHWNGSMWESPQNVETDCSRDNGQRFDLAYTDTSGYLISIPYDKNAVSSWGRIYWNTSVPAGTIIKVRTRTSMDSITWGSWSKWYENGDIITSPGNRWIQYFVWFETTDITFRPTLYDIVIQLNRPDIIINGTPSDNFGWSVSSAGDLNNDGYDDIIIGAPLNDSMDGNHADAGAVYIFYGNSTANLTNKTTAEADRMMYGETTNDHFGWSVAYAGNLDGMGKVEVIVGAPDFDNGSKIDVGKVYIYTTTEIIPEFYSIIIPILFISILIAIVRKRYSAILKTKNLKGVKG